MNWDAVGAIGEIVGASAVVISVIYLALQVKRQTEQAKLAATREISDQLDGMLSSFTEHPALSSLYLNAVQDFTGLDNEDRIKATFLFQRFARIYEQQCIHVEQGHFDPAFFESVDKTFFEWLTFPGVQQWWARNKGFFESSFEARVDRLLVQARQQGYDSSFSHRDEPMA